MKILDEKNVCTDHSAVKQGCKIEEKGKEKLLEMINESNNAVDGIHNVIKESLGEAYE